MLLWCGCGSAAGCGVHTDTDTGRFLTSRLALDDPVAAFFNFCRERDSIRCKREADEPGPWTEDAVFQQVWFQNGAGTGITCSPLYGFLPW